MSLKFKSEWLSIENRDMQFWAFYNANSKEFEKILWNASWKHKNHVDPEDMHSELLLRMHRSDFLTKFDAEKACFGTFVTGRVTGYSFHILGEHTRDTYENSFEIVKRPKGAPKNYAGEKIDATTTEKKAAEIVEQYQEEIGDKFDVALRAVKNENLPAHCSEMNGEDHEESSVELKTAPEFDEILSSNEIVQLINRRLSMLQVKILALYLGGSDISTIAKKVRTTKRAVIEHLDRIKTLARWVIKFHDNDLVKDQKEYVEKVENKNKHARAKKRDLDENEKQIITNAFIHINGIVAEDTALKILPTLGKDIAIFQVTGYIVKLHGMVKRGIIKLQDADAYNKVMEARRAKWKTYKSAKYQPGKYPKI